MTDNTFTPEQEQTTQEKNAEISTTIEHGGHVYEIRYTDKRVDLIEAMIKKSLMAAIQEHDSMLPMRELRIVIGLGLTNPQTGGYLSPEQGQDIAGAQIREAGYIYATAQALTALQRDCPFFFRVDL